MTFTLAMLHLVVILLLAGAAAPVDATHPDPLFASDSLIELTLEAPISTIMTERPEHEDIPGVLRMTGEDGAELVLDIGLRTRGEYRRRRDICPFAPLRLNFETSSVPGTVFSNQDKLKLVTHCRDRSQHYEQTVITEYLAYRILNLLTDRSFRVRLLRITYLDTDSERRLVKPGFLIEDKDRLADRLGLLLMEPPDVELDSLIPAYTNLTSVFHFLIGNTDFSPVQARQGEACCHNHVLFGSAGGPYYSVPYDFDQSGIVDAKHAAANPRFRLRSVRQRLYRGRCRNNELLPATLRRFRERRKDIEFLVRSQDGLSSHSRRATLRYIKGFYNVINDPDLVNRMLVRHCL